MGAMNVWLAKTCAFALAIVIMPGALELLENVGHLVAEGHLAHAAASGDHQEPSGSEHGCTPIFHSCGCHASLVFVGAQTPPTIGLRAAGYSVGWVSDPQLTAFWPVVDRPPRA